MFLQLFVARYPNHYFQNFSKLNTKNRIVKHVKTEDLESQNFESPTMQKNKSKFNKLQIKIYDNKNFSNGGKVSNTERG